MLMARRPSARARRRADARVRGQARLTAIAFAADANARDPADQELRRGQAAPAHEVDSPTRRALAEAMFSDVLVALRRTDSVDEMLVVTADHGAQRIAGGYGAMVLDDDDEGHNARRSTASARRSDAGADRVLLVPGDCPLLDPEELEQLLARPVVRAVPCVDRPRPPRHRARTRCCSPRRTAMTPAFGPGSCQRHVDDARAAGTGARGRRGRVAGARRRHARGPRGATDDAGGVASAAPRTRAGC